jgi:zinc protease
MINFERFVLANGLKVLFHKDTTTPMAVVNVLYDVGARDETEDKTGFAHLFEHLMFGGSRHIPDFDTVLQKAGGENNAFTSNDITNYYDILPAENLDTALWLESDRMLSLAFTPKSLEVQRNVVIEEFKQRYLNQPYGDVWLELRPLAYITHPYKWATIGKNIKHIEDATMNDVKSFFSRYYCPSNAILCVAGNVELEDIKQKVNYWFGSIPSGKKVPRILNAEPTQKDFRVKTILRNVPANAFYFAFKMPERKDPDYYIADVLSDILGREKSSKLYIRLQQELQLVTEISCYIFGSLDTGLFIISGKLAESISFEQFEQEFWLVVDEFLKEKINESELIAVKNKLKTSKAFQEQGLLNRAMNLSYFELLGDANGINEEFSLYDHVKISHIISFAKKCLKKNNCSLLRVKKK